MNLLPASLTAQKVDEVQTSEVSAGAAGRLGGGTAAALLIAFGVLMTSAPAQASIVYSGPQTLLIPVTTAGLYINVVTGATGTSNTLSGWDINPWGTGSLFVYGTNVGGVIANVGNNAAALDNLATGFSVGSGNTFNTTPNAIETTGATAFALNSFENYIGFAFRNEATNAINYGWMQISLGNSFTAPGRAVLGWAYENTGAAINVGAGLAPVGVPEPATIGLVLASLSALALTRRRS